MSERIRVGLAVLLGAIVRLPFWLEALRTPVDGDTAILGLMARHLGQGTSFWGQAYGSPAEAWVAAPFIAALGPTTLAVRMPGFLLGLALIPLAFALARELDPRAALPAALLAACPPAYLLLLASLPPPLYPTTLALCGLLLLLAVRVGDTLAGGARPIGLLALWGTLAGLALWTHLMSATIVAASAGFLVSRARGSRRAIAAAVVPLLLASAPVWWRLVGDPSATQAVGAPRAETTRTHHFGVVLPGLPRTLGGLLGTRVPVIADDPEHVVRAPAWAAAGLAIAYGILLALAASEARRRGPAVLLLVSAALCLLAFPFSLRSAPEAIRFLTPMYLPVATLVAWAAAIRTGARRGLAIVAVVAGLQAPAAAGLWSAWRSADRSAAPFFLPDLTETRRALEARGMTRAYASYGIAYRLTYESGEAIVSSQFRNERFPEEPLPYLDEVRFAKNVAWILTPGMPSDMPTPDAFEADLEVAGGRWQRTEAGAAILYHGFVPPFGVGVEALASAGRAGDGDLATRVLEAPGAAVLELPVPKALDAVTLMAGAGHPGLPRNLDVEVSADGRSFTTVARRRRQRERLDLMWVNGQPQYVLEPDIVAVPLGGRVVAAIRVAPAGPPEPWGVAEILVHPARNAAGEWDEWLSPGLSWADRGLALEARPLRDRADWYYRSLIAARHR